MFVEEESSEEMVAMAMEFVNYVWPLFLFAGTNMMISGYLTAIHRPPRVKRGGAMSESRVTGILSKCFLYVL